MGQNHTVEDFFSLETKANTLEESMLTKKITNSKLNHRNLSDVMTILPSHTYFSPKHVLN